MRVVKQALIRLDPILADVEQELILQEGRNAHGSGAFTCFGCGYHIFTVNAGIGLCDVDLMADSIQIIRCECEQFTLAHAGPVEQFKSGKSFRVIRIAACRNL